MPSGRATVFLAITLSLSLAGSAAAASPEMLRAFEEGRALVKQGDYPHAAEKFLESLRYERTVGAMLNLADCYEQMGRFAAARARFLEAAAIAEKDAVRAAEARARAARLDDVVGRLEFRRRRSGLPPEVTVDGDRVDIGGDSIVDPGVRTVTVRWANGRTRRSSISVTRGAIVPIDIDEPSEPVAVSPPAPAAAADSAPSTLQWVGMGTGAAGVATMGAGVVFGIIAAVERSELSERCPDYPRCPASERPSVDPAFEDARTAATVSTVTIVAGAVLAAAGVVIWIAAPRSKTSPAAVALSPEGVLVVW